MLEDIDKSIKATMYDRLTSPLIGSYITAWCICNYKFFLIVFSSLSYFEKITQIENLYFGLNWIFRWGGPVIWAFLYITVYPVIAKWVFRRWQKYIKDKKEIKNAVQNETCLTVAQSQQLRLELAQKTFEFEKITADKSETIKNLSAQNKFFSEQSESLKAKIAQVTEQYKNIIDRENLVTKYGLHPNGNGSLECREQGTSYYEGHICIKCFYDTPPKMIRLKNDWSCPACNAKYDDMNFLDHGKEIFSTNDQFKCWKSNHIGPICPQCYVKYKSSEYARLITISPNELFCPVCEKKFIRYPLLENNKKNSSEK